MKIIANGIALIGIVIDFLSLQQKRKKNIMNYQVMANVMFSIQYLLLGTYSAACACAIAILRGIFFRKREKETKKINKLIFLIILFFISSIISYDGLLSLLPIIVGIIIIVSACFSKPKTYKMVFGLSSIPWIYYNFKVKAYISIIDCLFCLISAIIDHIKNIED